MLSYSFPTPTWLQSPKSKKWKTLAQRPGQAGWSAVGSRRPAWTKKALKGWVSRKTQAAKSLKNSSTTFRRGRVRTREPALCPRGFTA